MVYFDLTGLCGRRWTGVENVAFHFVQTVLRDRSHSGVCVVLSKDNDNVKNEFVGCEIKVLRSAKRLIVEYFLLPLWIMFAKPEVVFYLIFPPSFIAWIVKPKKTKYVVAIHDVVPWKYRETMSWKARTLMIPRYKRSLKKADYVLTVSETERIALKDLGCKRPIAVIYNPINEQILKRQSSILTQLGLMPGGYILTASTIEPRKNFFYLLEVVNRLFEQGFTKKLVVVGKKGWGVSSSIYDRYSDKILFTDYVDNDALSHLYANAFFYITLPLHEGFGRTAVEALLNDCCTFVSDIKVFHELLADNVTYLPLNDSAVAAENILNTISKSSFSMRRENLAPELTRFLTVNYQGIVRETLSNVLGGE